MSIKDAPLPSAAFEATSVEKKRVAQYAYEAKATFRCAPLEFRVELRAEPNMSTTEIVVTGANKQTDPVFATWHLQVVGVNGAKVDLVDVGLNATGAQSVETQHKPFPLNLADNSLPLPTRWGVADVLIRKPDTTGEYMQPGAVIRTCKLVSEPVVPRKVLRGYADIDALPTEVTIPPANPR